MISLMLKRRKLRSARITELADRVKTLESAHKRSLAADSLEALLSARKDLLGELQVRLKCKFALTNKLYYEFGNKSGKLLANALQKKKAAHTIHSITTPTGEMLHRSDLIAKQFTSYLSSIYNLPNPSVSGTPTPREKLIEDFLSKYGAPAAPTPDLTHLGAPVSIDEGLEAIATGKKPWPGRFDHGLLQDILLLTAPSFCQGL